MTINEEVVRELRELKKLGVMVKDKTIKMAESSDLSEYDNMSVSEIADLLILLA
jgi:hypothetical protein